MPFVQFEKPSGEVIYVNTDFIFYVDENAYEPNESRLMYRQEKSSCEWLPVKGSAQETVEKMNSATRMTINNFTGRQLPKLY